MRGLRGLAVRRFAPHRPALRGGTGVLAVPFPPRRAPARGAPVPETIPMPRPTLPYYARKRRTTVWLSPDEIEHVDEKASAANLSRAEFVRRAALGQRVAGAVPDANRAAWAELARTTSNLNQLVYHLNTGSEAADADADILATLDDLRAEVAALRRELIGGDE